MKTYLSLVVVLVVMLFAVSAYAACETDADCVFAGFSLICIDGECSEESDTNDNSQFETECDRDDECAEYEVCRDDGFCVRRDCNDDSDCNNDDYYCRGDGICAPLICQWDNDCLPYEFCIRGECEFQPANFLEAGGDNCRSVPNITPGAMAAVAILIALAFVRRKESR